MATDSYLGDYPYSPFSEYDPTSRKRPFDFGPGESYSGFHSSYRHPVVWRPRCDILEIKDNVRVEFELPGVDKEDILLSANEGVLILTTTKKKTEEEMEGAYFMRERHFGPFYRKVVLPDYVDTRKVDALLENGVLKVVFKLQTTAERQTNMIPIKTRNK